MKILLIVASVMWGAMTVPQSGPVEAPPLPSDWIVSEIGSEASARQVVNLILGSLFEERHRGRDYVLASQIRKDWLPDQATTKIIRLVESDVRRHLATCGHYWVLSDIRRTSNVVSMKVSEKCGCTFKEYVATFENDVWHLGSPYGARGGGWVEGIGSGCVGPPPGCPCLGR